MRVDSVAGPFLLAQLSGAGRDAGWFILGGAIVVLAVGVAIVILVRSGRRDDLDDRIAVRYEASAAAEPPPPRQPARPRGSRPTFIDLPSDRRTGHIDIHIGPGTEPQGRRSPMSDRKSAADEEHPQTFVDLPDADPIRRPVVDLNDESVDITEEREESASKRDPWT